MKALMLTTILLLAVSFSVTAKQVNDSTVNYVYQLDSDANTFEFNASVANGCGSNSYRVKSPNEAVASRKFAMVLTAFTSNNKLTFHDAEICESGRSVVTWIRLTH